MIGFWTHPGWLWGLLLLPIYFLLLLISLSLRSRSIPDLRIWREVRDTDPREQSRFPAAAYWVSALLLSLLLGGILVALAGPASRTLSKTTALLHVVVDRSASMSAVESDGRTRYRHALDRLRTYADRMPDGARWRVTLPGRPPRTLEGIPNELIEQLSGTSPTDLSFQRSIGASLKDVLRSPADHTLLVTDRQRKAPGSSFRPEVSVLPVGSRRPNTGLLSLYGSLRNQRLTLFVRLGHFGSNTRTVSVSASKQNGASSVSRQVSLSPNEPVSITLQIPNWPRSTVGRVQIDRSTRDALNADNRAYFVTGYPFRTRVNIHGPENDHLSRMLDSLPLVVPSGAGEANMDLFYRPNASTTEQLWRRGAGRPAVIIAPERPASLKDTFISSENVRLELVLHEITADLPVDSVSFRRATLLKPGAARNVTPLLDGPSGMLSFVRNDVPNTLWFLENPFLTPESGPPPTKWSVHPDRASSFVMFWQNAFSYFRPWSLDLHGDLVHWPTGASPFRRRSARSSDSLPHVNTERVGVHEIDRDGRTLPVPVNLLDATESNTHRSVSKPAAPPPLPDPEQLKTDIRYTQPLTVALLAALFVILPALRYLHAK